MGRESDRIFRVLGFSRFTRGLSGHVAAAGSRGGDYGALWAAAALHGSEGIYDFCESREVTRAWGPALKIGT
jgi:hypothetical protein